MDKRKRRLLCMLEGGKKYKWIRGAPPLSFRAQAAGTLENYRIYGNTVGGESVGDLVESGEHAGEYKVPVTVEGKNLFNFDEPNVKGYDFEKQSEGVYYIADTGSLYGANRYKLDTETGKQYVFKGVVDNTNIVTQLSGYLEGTENPVEGPIFKTGNINIIFTANGKTTLTIFGYKANQSATVTNLQVYDISITDDTYEPYQPPVTTNLYLPEQIRKVGDEAEYIDYGEQKMHRIGADDIDVTLPALPTIKGTNVLSVGTAVQPSEIEVKGKIKAL